MKLTLPRLIALFTLALISILSVSAVHADDGNATQATRAEVRFLEGMSDHHQMALDMAQDCLTKNVADDLRAVCQGVIDAQTAEIQQMHDWLLVWYGIEYKSMPMSAMSGMGEMDMHGMCDMAHMDKMDDMHRHMCGMDGMGEMGGKRDGMGEMGGMSAEATPGMCAADEGCDMRAESTPGMGDMDMRGADTMRAEATPGMDHTHGADSLSAEATPGMGGMDMSGMSGEAMSDPPGMMGMFAGFSRLDGRDYEIAWLESMIDHHDDAIHMSQRVLKLAQHPELVTLANNIIEAQSAEIEKMQAMLAARGDS